MSETNKGTDRASGHFSADRRTMLGGLAAAGITPILGIGMETAMAADKTGKDDLTWMPAWRIRDMVASGKITASAVTEHFIARIGKIDPVLHAFRAFDPEGARSQARAIDEAVAQGKPVGPLAGVPIAIKDHVAVKGLPVFDGSPSNNKAAALQPAARDSVVAERLRAAGAIIMGVTIMPGMGIGAGMPDLARHPRNPWDPKRVPGSSSAGSAAAVAAGMVPVAIGSDGGGSTRLPAALTGTIGVHTTIGRVPNLNLDHPDLPLTTSLGPIARDVRDAAIVMQAIAGPDGRDMLSTIHPPAPDYLAALNDGARGMKMAWTDDYGFTRSLGSTQTDGIIDAVRNAAQGVSALGAAFTPVDEQWESFWPHYLVTTAAYSVRPGTQRPSTEDLIRSSEVRARNRAKFDALLTRFDVLMSPTIQFTAPTVEEWDRSWRDVLKFSPVYTSDTFMFNWLGLPAMSVPCGFVEGLPIGLQLVGPPDSEPKLFRIAQAFLTRFPRTETPPPVA
ncbi:Asp-tRNA(Asn)/Glu-tRNA(Gln) amidotransferase A subunit family amidase [Sphingobium wenxiniae]|uniref:Amidase domain-containing protein n=3 Tax=Sphingomonadaceae TaxID=41297 RepID=T0GA87_9SPHN|nr:MULTISPECIES: amidase [Sphingobium]EQA96927.1 hypothetical protein L485_22895 [Sphingobium baderi LL03]MBB6191108.1 Asp-tRNA(Asn)/Glu-tRNA(Gln) amidotransferase A subunit family amidase [Sphingobium wenxiniae]TWH96092.1 aspartyl-tRNA(Asn)/glutamyl-tRNA(Gln) amidotransferase subunit A [Sphingobium wenxiniae]WRD77963.1 amidase [Sphingobium baderi]